MKYTPVTDAQQAAWEKRRAHELECVNACEGLNPAAIREVVEALEKIANSTVPMGGDAVNTWRENAHIARAALAHIYTKE